MNQNKPESNEVDRNALGGTELLKNELYRRIPDHILHDVQIICSRVRKIEPYKPTILWLHDLPEDPESLHLANNGWQRYNKLVFVSYWQQQRYHDMLGIPFFAGVVIPNAIWPLPEHEKNYKRPIRIIYTPTPHRGLEILVPAFERLSKIWATVGIDVELDVYSSFNLYGWPERDEEYEWLFNQCRKHPKINYHGTVSNDTIRTALLNSHIFAYPSIWPETSCLCLIEAMSAKLICVHSAFGALPETSKSWNMMYNMSESIDDHATSFSIQLQKAVLHIEKRKQLHTPESRIKKAKFWEGLNAQKEHIDKIHSWQRIENNWRNLIQSVEQDWTNG